MSAIANWNTGARVATMKDISVSSHKISHITGVIDGIAFQTNILALNAAVAAKVIKVLIGESVSRVEAGSRLVEGAGGTMDEIVQQVRQVAQLIAEIGTATEQQSVGIGEVSRAVSQLDQVTQQNAALVEESAAAADSLNQQARRLTEVVGAFKLDSSASY